MDRTRDLEPPPAAPIGWKGVRLDAMLAESERLFADTGHYHGLDRLEMVESDRQYRGWLGREVP